MRGSRGSVMVLGLGAILGRPIAEPHPRRGGVASPAGPRPAPQRDLSSVPPQASGSPRRARRNGPRVRRVTIETVSACNLRCIHCPVSNDDYVGRVLALEDFRRILPVLRRFRPVVQLSGHGETLMHKHFRQMFLEVLQTGSPLTFQTNATLLDGETIEFLLEHAGRARFRALRVSLDAAERELFEAIRRRADWDVYLGNLRALRDAKRARGLLFPLLHLEFVAMRHNIHQLADVVDLAAELGAATLSVSDLVEYPLCAGQNLRRDLGGTLPHLRRGVARASEIGFTLEPFPGIAELLGPQAQLMASPPASAPAPAPVAAPGPGRADLPAVQAGVAPHAGAAPPERPRLRLCTDPWEFLFLKADGSFDPCCWITEPILPPGEPDVLAAWDGPAYRGLRAALSSAAPPAPCLACYARPWTEVPGFVLGRPDLVHALFRSRQAAEEVRKNVRGLSKHTRGFTRPGKLLEVLRGIARR